MVATLSIMPFSSRRSRFRRRRRRRPRRMRGRRPRRRRALRLDPERKNLDFNLLNSPITADGTLVMVNDHPGSTAPTGRIGRQALYVSFTLSGVLRHFSANSTAYRFMLVHVRQPAGAPLLLVDLLTTPVTPVTSLRNLDTLGQYRWLWSRRMKSSPLADTNIINVKMHVKFRILGRWADQNGGVINLESGAIWLVLTSDHAMGAVNPPQFTFSSRVRFVG